ncbi:MAG: hypothetical protein DHS20C21_03200 [Gemmatimonadota bacterium]|nr:MAG: hypothetical protein DHS20C21_03200 [Gemmatimonadota bacterium]
MFPGSTVLGMTIRSEAEIRADITATHAKIQEIRSKGVAEIDSPEGDGSVRFVSLSEYQKSLDSLYKELSIVVRSGAGYSGSHLASFERGS